MARYGGFGQASPVLNTPIVVKDAQGLPVGGVLIQITDQGSSTVIAQGLTAVGTGTASIPVPVAGAPSGYFSITPTKRGVSFDPPSTSYDVYTDQGSIQATTFTATIAPIPVKAMPMKGGMPTTAAAQLPMNLNQYMPLIYLGGAVVAAGLLILIMKPSKKAAPTPAAAPAVADAVAFLRHWR